MAETETTRQLLLSQLAHQQWRTQPPEMGVCFEWICIQFCVYECNTHSDRTQLYISSYMFIYKIYTLIKVCLNRRNQRMINTKKDKWETKHLLKWKRTCSLFWPELKFGYSACLNHLLFHFSYGALPLCLFVDWKAMPDKYFSLHFCECSLGLAVQGFTMKGKQSNSSLTR